MCAIFRSHLTDGATTVVPSTRLFSLVFEQIGQAGNESDGLPIWISNEVMEPFAVGAALEKLPLSMGSPVQQAYSVGTLVGMAPNPSDQETKITLVAPVPEQAQIRVVDLKGVQLFQADMDLLKGENTLTLPTRDWPAGVYFLSMKQRSGPPIRYRFSVVHH